MLTQAAAETKQRTRVLFVDDEPMVLEGLSNQLYRQFDVVTATSGADGLAIIEAHGPFAVVMSDMKMPKMNGVEFLSRVREMAPESVRILLTGYTDIDNAIAAVNDGQIFRFLTKPCPYETLVSALRAGEEQHNLIVAERVLLEKTLYGSIKALMDVLAIYCPATYGRATRIKRRVSELAAAMSIPKRWIIEIAAMLSHLGSASLPPQSLDKIYSGQELDESEKRMAERIPLVTNQILANIPKLGPVREIVLYQHRRYDGSDNPNDSVSGEALPWGARALKAITDLEILEAQNMPAGVALGVMQSRAGWYDPAILETLTKLTGTIAQESEIRDMFLKDIQQGMIMAEDIKLKTGSVVIARGHEATLTLLERLRNLSNDFGVVEPIKVIMRR